MRYKWREIVKTICTAQQASIYFMCIFLLLTITVAVGHLMSDFRRTLLMRPSDLMRGNRDPCNKFLTDNYSKHRSTDRSICGLSTNRGNLKLEWYTCGGEIPRTAHAAKDNPCILLLALLIMLGIGALSFLFRSSQLLVSEQTDSVRKQTNEDIPWTRHAPYTSFPIGPLLILCACSFILHHQVGASEITPSLSSSATDTPSSSETSSMTASITTSASGSASETQIMPTETASATASESSRSALSPSETSSMTASASGSPSETQIIPTESASPTASESPSSTLSPSETSSMTASIATSASGSPSETQIMPTESASPTVSESPSGTLLASGTSSMTASASGSARETQIMPTESASATSSESSRSTLSPSETCSMTASASGSASETQMIQTESTSPTAGESASSTLAPFGTSSMTASMTTSASGSASESQVMPSKSATRTASESSRSTLLPNETSSITAIRTTSASGSASETSFTTASITPSLSESTSETQMIQTESASPTASESPSSTLSASETSSMTASASGSASETQIIRTRSVTSTTSESPSSTAREMESKVIATRSASQTTTQIITSTRSPSEVSAITPSMATASVSPSASESLLRATGNMSPTPSDSPRTTPSPSETSSMTSTMTASASPSASETKMMPTQSAPTPKSVEPAVINVEYNRSFAVASIIEKPVFVSVRENEKLEWQQPSHEFFVVPADTTIMENDTIVEQSLRIETADAPKGRTVETLQIKVIKDETLVRVLDIQINLTIHEGFITAHTNEVLLTKSRTDTSSSRGVLVSNTGSHGVEWNATIYDEDATDVTLEQSNWVSLDRLTGNLSPTTTSSILSVYFFPNRVQRNEIYRSWILIETNSWDGMKGTLPSRAPEMLRNRPSTTVHFWIEARMLVTSIFLFESGAESILLQPLQTGFKSFTIVNTEATDILVLPTNFTMSVTKENETKAFRVSPSRRSQLVLTPWLSLSRSVATISSGSRMTYEVHALFPSSNLSVSDNAARADLLPPAKISLDFTLAAFLGSAGILKASEANDLRTVSIQLDFVPGKADPQLSYIHIGENTTDFPVMETFEITLVLADQFGQTPATATYYPPENVDKSVTYFSTENVDNSDESSLHLEWLAVGEREKPDIHTTMSTGLVEGTSASAFSLTIRFLSEGDILLDVVVDGTSISNSPKLLKGKPISCTGKYETASDDGTECLCKAGHSRSRDSEGGTLECIPCKEGFITQSRNKDFQCEACPGKRFCIGGNSMVLECPAKGVDCSDGKLRLMEGFWCEACHSETYPRDKIVALLENEQEPVFHECPLSDACIVNATSFQSSCNEGYKGPVCSVCQDGFALNAQDTDCTDCGDQRINRLTVVAGILVVLAALTLLTYKYSIEVEIGDVITDEDMESVSTIPRTGGQNQTEQVSRKQLEAIVMLSLDYFQICAIFANLPISPFRGIASWLAELSELSLFNVSESIHFQCTFRVQYMLRATLSMLFPWIVAIVILLCQMFVVLVLLGKPLTKKAILQGVVPVTVIFFSLLHASVTDGTLAALEMYPKKIEGTRRLAGDLRIEEGSDEHNTVFTVAMVTLVIYVIGFPLGVSSVLLQKWRQGDFWELHHRFGSWTGAFTVKRVGFLWPIVAIFRKVILLLVNQFVTEAFEQYVVVTIVLILSYFLVSWLRPHQLQIVTNLEKVKLIIALLTIGLGAILFATSTSWQQPSLERVEFSLSVLVIILQAFMLFIAISTALMAAPHLRLSASSSNCFSGCRCLCRCGDKTGKIFPRQSIISVESNNAAEAVYGAFPRTPESRSDYIPRGTASDTVIADEDVGSTLTTETKQNSIRAGEFYHFSRSSDTDDDGVVDETKKLYSGIGDIGRPRGASDIEISEDVAETKFRERLEELE